MENRWLLMAGMTALLINVPYAQELCTEDIIFNTDFNTVDNLGDPVDWEKRKADNYDHRGLSVEDGVLKIWTTEEGNFEDYHEYLFLGQSTYNPQGVFSILANDTLYVRAKVKSTAIDAPSAQELAEKCECDPDSKKYIENFHSQSGFQVAIQQANKPGGPPWFIPLAWTPVTDHDGSAIEEFTWLSGNVVLDDMANYLGVWILLNSKSAATVWIDSIQLSSRSDFCVGTVPVKHHEIIEKKSKVKLNNATLYFGTGTSYTLNVFHPNGKRCVAKTGYASTIDLNSFALPTGAYIIKVQSNTGTFTQSFIINKSMNYRNDK